MRICEVCGSELNNDQEIYCSTECQFIGCQLENAKKRKKKNAEIKMSKLDEMAKKARELGISYGEMRTREITKCE